MGTSVDRESRMKNSFIALYRFLCTLNGTVLDTVVANERDATGFEHIFAYRKLLACLCLEDQGQDIRHDMAKVI